MYCGEMEGMGHNFASILGMHPSTFDCLRNSTSNLKQYVTIRPMDGKDGLVLAYNVMTCYLYVYWRDHGKHGKHGA
jgi:hypothetical protein